MRVLIISSCWDCPRILIPSMNENVCGKMNRGICDPDEIPEWCPLPKIIEKEDPGDE